jgi:hypothetical protein
MRRSERFAKKGSTALLICLMIFSPVLFVIDLTGMMLWWVARLPQKSTGNPWQIAAVRVVIAMLFLRAGYRY